MNLWIVVCLVVATSTQAATAQNWDNSPNNFKNSPYDYNNSANAWRNSPNNYNNSVDAWANSSNNWENSPNNPKNYTVHDSRGNLTGYYARNSNGVLVYFDNKGKRQDFKPNSESTTKSPDFKQSAPKSND
jgi:hypothetical protein